MSLPKLESSGNEKDLDQKGSIANNGQANDPFAEYRFGGSLPKKPPTELARLEMPSQKSPATDTYFDTTLSPREKEWLPRALPIDAAHQHDFDAIAARTAKYRDQHFSEEARSLRAFKHFINTKGRQPRHILATALRDPTNLVFFGEAHPPEHKVDCDDPQANLGHPVVADMRPGSIMMVELPQMFKPVFDAYNRSPKGAKFYIPDKLKFDGTGSSELAKLRAYRQNRPNLFEMFETAHANGVKLVPVDSDVDFYSDNNPWSRAKAMTPIKQAEREKIIRDNILTVLNENPNSPASVWIGSYHASEGNKYQSPVARMLSQDAEFAQTGRNIVSFHNITERLVNRMPKEISLIADDLYSSVCLAMNEPEMQALKDTPVYPNSDVAATFGDYDYIILHSQRATLAPYDGAKYSGPFLREELTENEKSYYDLVEPIKLPADILHEAVALLNNNRPKEKDLLGLKQMINENGQDPEDVIAAAIRQPGSVIVGRPLLFAKAIKEMPSGSCLAVETHPILRPLFDYYNATKPSTQFNLNDPDLLKKFLNGKEPDKYMQAAFESLKKHVSPEALNLWQSAHNNGIKILPYGDEYEIVDQVEQKYHRLNEFCDERAADKLAAIIKQNPNVPIIVASDTIRTDLPTPHGKATFLGHLLEDERFKTANREIILFTEIRAPENRNGWSLSTLSETIKKPVCINLRDTSSEYLRRAQNSGPPSGIGKDCSSLLALHEDNFSRYNRLIIYPATKK